MDIQTNREGYDVRKHADHPFSLPIIRFLLKIRVSETRYYGNTPCWEWIGCRGKSGYGQFKIEARRGITRKSSPHVFAFEFFNGDIPDGCEVDHLCRNRACCNPLHLDPKTRRDNVLAGETLAAANAQKEECKQGHPLAGDNLHIGPRGRRICRECRRERQKRFHAANPGAQKRYRPPKSA